MIDRARLTTLYVLHDIHGAVLYVGISSAPWTRMYEHTDKNWWEHVAAATFTHYPDRVNAERAERTLIAALRPPGNSMYLPDVPQPHPSTLEHIPTVFYKPTPDDVPTDPIVLDDPDEEPPIAL